MGWIRVAPRCDREPCRAQVQGGRRRALPAAGPEQRPAAGRRHRRPGLHAGGRQAAERARPWRAAVADDRPRQGGGDPGPARASARAAGCCFATRKGFGFMAEEKEIAAPDPGRQAGREPRRRRRAAAAAPVGGRPRGGGRRATASCWSSRWRELPVQARGKGVTLMRLKDAELADLKTLDAAQGLTWTANGKEGREPIWRPGAVSAPAAGARCRVASRKRTGFLDRMLRCEFPIEGVCSFR